MNVDCVERKHGCCREGERERERVVVSQIFCPSKPFSFRDTYTLTIAKQTHHVFVVHLCLVLVERAISSIMTNVVPGSDDDDGEASTFLLVAVVTDLVWNAEKDDTKSKVFDNTTKEKDATTITNEMDDEHLDPPRLLRLLVWRCWMNIIMNVRLQQFC